MRLRIIAGEFGGRLIDAPSGFTTHPMGERIRNALFNILGDISGKTVLDPYAGSGAIAIEAVSRGAAYAIAIEKDRKAQTVIAENIASLHLQDRVQLIRANCRAWSESTMKKVSSSAVPLQSTAIGPPPIQTNSAGTVVLKPLSGGDGAQVASEGEVTEKEKGLPLFDFIIADPPYNNLQLSTISLLTRHLKSTGDMILSHPGRESAPTVNGVVVVDNREYGDAALAIYRKEL